MEVRKGNFNYEFNGIDYGLVRDTRKVPKYSYAMNRWVLEEIIYSKYTPQELVAQGPLSYEPIWVFWKGDGEYVEPDLFHVDQICFFRVNNTAKGHVPTEAQLAEQKKAKDAANVSALREKLDDAIPDIPHALVHGEAVFIDSTKTLKENDAKS